MAKPLRNGLNLLNAIISIKVNTLNANSQLRNFSKLYDTKNDETNKHPKIADIETMNVLSPTFNLSQYVRTSSNLQQFVKLGMDLHKIENRKGLAKFILQQEFNANVSETLFFLQDQGVPCDLLGQWLTRNPLILKNDLATLQRRIDYLSELSLNKEERSRIITLNPYWLMFSTQRIERRLGFIQRNFSLSNREVLSLIAKHPLLVTYNLEHICEAIFCFREEMGFKRAELKIILLKKPRLLMMHSNNVLERFVYAHKEMQLSHKTLIDFPEVLSCRLSRLRDRHEFLMLLGRAQYDSKNDLYISLDDVVKGSDAAFCRFVAKCELHIYESFLWTR